MKKSKLKFLKKESGITLIALVTTIIVMAIMSAPLIMKTSQANDYRKFNRFKNDLLNLKEVISNTYSTDEELSSDEASDMYIGPEYAQWQDFINKVKGAKQGENDVLNPNDEASSTSKVTYFVIDFNNLEERYNKANRINLLLNYGERNKDIKNTSSDDVYIINSKSRTIYYAKGYTLNNITYYRYQEHYTPV